jgi:hypothetical protein
LCVSSRKFNFSSFLIPHSSFLIPHSSFLIPHSSFLIPHSSFLSPHSSFLIPHSSFLIPHSSFLRLAFLFKFKVKSHPLGLGKRFGNSTNLVAVINSVPRNLFCRLWYSFIFTRINSDFFQIQIRV